MLQDERRQKIIDSVQSGGKITIADICDMFNVSEMTARRDLRDLDREGSLRRVHGGAISTLGRSYEPPYNLRQTQAVEAKRAIGKKAAEMVVDGDSIALDVGTTTLEIARSLSGKHNLTIITASLPIANEIASQFSLGAEVRLILTGGIVRSIEFSMIGHIAENTYRELHVDKAFIGVGGISLKEGLTEYNLEDALVKRPLLGSAKQNIIVAEGMKFGRTSFAAIGPLSSIHSIVTDKTAPKEIIRELIRKGIDVIMAD